MRLLAVALLVCAAEARAQHLVPFREIGAADARSAVAINAIFPVINTRSDGTVVVADTSSRSALVLDRTLKLVQAAHVTDTAQSDPAGRFVYAMPAAPRSDSAAVVRVHAITGAADTVARIRVHSARTELDTLGSGRPRWRMTLEVLPTIDEWTLLPDGTVAVVRGADYHIDWYAPDGTHKATPKMPIDWRRMTDVEKRQRVESARAYYESQRGDTERGEEQATIEFAEPATLPDYVPPVSVGGVRSDPRGNVWILPSSSSYAGYAGFMYDVVNRRGQIVERVRLPRGRVLAGFAPNGDVYMMSMESGGNYLERVGLR